MTMLVTCGSKRGGTQGLAVMLAGALRREGFEVEVVLPKDVRSLEPYDVVIVGGALYAMRWHRAATRFVKRHAAELREHPTYFFSSGPLDDSAVTGTIAPVKGVQALMERVGARGHVTFGGRLSRDAKGFPASAMAKKRAGDWRDTRQVEQWARFVATDLRSGAAVP